MITFNLGILRNHTLIVINTNFIKTVIFMKIFVEHRSANTFPQGEISIKMIKAQLKILIKIPFSESNRLDFSG